MSVDTIGNFLTSIRNGVMASKNSVVVPYSKLKKQIAEILKSEGFINDFVVEENNNKQQLKIFLRYINGESAIHEIKRVSTPGCRVYKGVSYIEPVINGLGISILTTNQGIITNKKAKQISIGGELICTVW